MSTDACKARWRAATDKYTKARTRNPRKALVMRLRAARGRSRVRKIPCTITLEELEALYDQQQGRCLLTGHRFEGCDEGVHTHALHPYSISMDQIHPGRGYIPGNVRLICTDVNLAMNVWGEASFRHMARAYLWKWGNEHPLEDCLENTTLSYQITATTQEEHHGREQAGLVVQDARSGGSGTTTESGGAKLVIPWTGGESSAVGDDDGQGRPDGEDSFDKAACS